MADPVVSPLSEAEVEANRLDLKLWNEKFRAILPRCLHDDALMLAALAAHLTAEVSRQRAEIERLQQERDEARGIVAKVNNEVIGSDGFFTEPSCVEAIGNLKFESNRLRAALSGVEALPVKIERIPGGLALPDRVWASIHETAREVGASVDQVRAIAETAYHAGFTDCAAIEVEQEAGVEALIAKLPRYSIRIVDYGLGAGGHDGVLIASDAGDVIKVEELATALKGSK